MYSNQPGSIATVYVLAAILGAIVIAVLLCAYWCERKREKQMASRYPRAKKPKPGRPEYDVTENFY